MRISPRPLGRVFLRQQFLGGHVAEARVGHVSVPVGEAQLHRLRDHMHVLRGVVSHRLQVEALEDVQRHEHDDALRVGRALVDVEPRVAHLDGIRLLGLVAREVLVAQQPALRLVVVGAHPRQPAPIEGVRALARDLFQRPRQILLHVQVAHSEQPPARHQQLTRGGVGGDLLHRALVVPGNPEVERMPLAGGADRGRQHLFPWQAPVARMGQLEGAHRARDVGGQRPCVGDALVFLVELARRERGCVPGSINEEDAVLGGEIGDHEGVAPDPGLVLLHDRRHVEDR